MAESGIGPGVHAGLFGRFMLLAYAGWVIVSGVRARRLNRAGVVSTPARQVPVGA